MPYTFDHDTITGRRPNAECDPLVGTVLDEHYLIEDRIATGGFGAIYRARTAGGELVALKVLHPRLTGDPSIVARFRREGAILTQLHDRHTVRTFALGETVDGTLYIAMELLSGESLHDHLRRAGTLPWQTAVAIARAVCSSLAEAHALGVVHRDLKPANIHVEIRGDTAATVKVIDFGVGKIARGSAIDDGHELTRAGHTLGTYDYMSPEQILGEACSAASDIYSLGIVLYEMLTGEHPFAQTGSPSLMTALLAYAPLPPSALSAAPPELDRIVLRCLEREPAARFGEIATLACALDELPIARGTPQDELTTVKRLAWDTIQDERTWPPPATGPDGGEPVWDAAEPGDPSALAPWTVPMVGAFAASERDEEPARADPLPVAPHSSGRTRTQHATLPGVAVAPGVANVRRSEPELGCSGRSQPAAPVALVAPAAPAAPATEPVAQASHGAMPSAQWFLSPIPRAPLASESRPDVPEASDSPAQRHRLWWFALAILAIAALVITIVVIGDGLPRF